jgi:hypothetical protein
VHLPKQVEAISKKQPGISPAPLEPGKQVQQAGLPVIWMNAGLPLNPALPL